MTTKRERSGFTLVEAVIAFAVCALILAGAYPLLTSTTRKLYQARDHYAATTICLAQIERARDIPYEQLGSALGRDNQVRVNEMGANDSQGRFRRTTSVRVDYPDSGLTSVSVTTDIMNRKTGAFTNELETMSYLFTAYLKPVGE